MGYIIQISEDKMEGLAEHATKMMKHGKKLLECIEDLSEGSMGERRVYGGMGYRDDDDDYDMGERRGVRGTGRYSRLR